MLHISIAHRSQNDCDSDPGAIPPSSCGERISVHI